MELDYFMFHFELDILENPPDFIGKTKKRGLKNQTSFRLGLIKLLKITETGSMFRKCRKVYHHRQQL